jgi:hypothetical protein
MATIANKYYVGPKQPYSSVSQAINVIKNIIDSGDYTLPSATLADGGNVNIVISDGGIHQPFTIPSNFTQAIYSSGRRFVITRQEFKQTGVLNTSNMPAITSSAAGSSEVSIADKAIGINVGSNNPGVTLRGLYVKDCVSGIQAGFNSNYLRIERCFISNSSNLQIYAHNLEGLNLVNNIIIGGEYGIIAKYVKNIRAYHNTVFIDGATALNGKAKAGVILQAERTFGNNSPSTIYFAGNLIYTVGAPALILYDGDLSSSRVVSDYNNLFRPDGNIVQLRQDTTQLTDEAEIILKEYADLKSWRKSGPLGSDNTTPIDKNSISIDPVFIQKTFIAGTETSVLDLSLISSSPVLGKVPSWYSTTDSTYIPSDFSSALLNYDALLNTREKPKTAIGANDAPSSNGYFGQDLFTSPLSITPDQSCDVDPLAIVTNQKIDMMYPKISAGFFWSHERPYYLYAKKGASQLGYLAKTTFKLPGHVLSQNDMTVKIQGKEIPQDSWDIRGQELIVLHKDYGIASYEDEVHINAKINGWDNNGFFKKNAYYVFKIRNGKTEFLLPEEYNPQGPVVITDDRISLRDPLDLVRREFTVEYDSERQESVLRFLHTENMVENSMFNISQSAYAPSYWDTDHNFTDQIFLLGQDFSYYGDYAAGIKLGARPGWLGTSYIPVDDSKPITLSWHCRIPTGMGMSGATGHYLIKWYDQHNKETSDKTISGHFHISETGFSRYYVTVGNQDTDVSDDTYDNFGIPVVNTQDMIVTPSNISSLQLIISGDYNQNIAGDSFFVLDAVQAEYSNHPTYYHPQLSFDYMTVEWESSDDNYFVDKRMNITPVFNENPNGFLTIQDMPATIWEGPKDDNITSLHEYKWPLGRLNHLPWARLHGKDKLTQKAKGTEELSVPLDIISPYAVVAIPTKANMDPDVVNITQFTGDVAGFNITVVDKYSNPYSLRRYTMQVYDPNDNYPGLIAKRYFGAKEQLGTTIYGELNSNGSVSAEYSPVSSDLIRYVGKMPVPQSQAEISEGVNDTISSISTPYMVYPENNGNITVIGKNGKLMQTEGTKEESLELIGNSNGSVAVVTLPYPPVFGSLKVKHNGLDFYETLSTPQSNEFEVSYSYGQFTVSSEIDLEKPFVVSYIPKYAYPDPYNYNKVIFHHNKVFGNYNGPITVDYDAHVFIEIRVEKPFAGELIAAFDVVLQNPQLSKITNESLSLEF